MNGKTLNLADNMEIKSNNFNVDSQGNMKCNNARMNDADMHNVKIDGGKIVLTNVPSDTNQYFRIISNTGENFSASSSRIWLNRGTGETAIYMQGGDLSQSAIVVRDKDNSETAIHGSGIYTPQLTQTSLKESKKNFEKLQNKALEIIKNIDIYKYNLKSENEETKKHIGFVIGDQYKYSKEITNSDNTGVDIYSFVSLCCKAIQEQQEQIEELQNEFKKYKKGEK